MEMDARAVLEKTVRVGKVSSVDVEARTVRVVFEDKQDGDGNPLISGPLKVIQNVPLITVEKWVEEGKDPNQKWNFSANYNSHDRNLGIGESYVKDKYETLKDTITDEKIIKYEKLETISEGSPIPVSCGGAGSPCPLNGIIEHKYNKTLVTVYPWLPYVGQYVLCLFLPNGKGDGFVLGGI